MRAYVLGMLALAVVASPAASQTRLPKDLDTEVAKALRVFQVPGMAIAVVKDGQVHVQAGGGTVADAKPDYEYEESRAKARGVVRAIELAARQADWA